VAITVAGLNCAKSRRDCARKLRNFSRFGIAEHIKVMIHRLYKTGVLVAWQMLGADNTGGSGVRSPIKSTSLVVLLQELILGWL